MAHITVVNSLGIFPYEKEEISDTDFLCISLQRKRDIKEVASALGNYLLGKCFVWT